MAVNETRAKLNQNVNRAVSDAQLIGFNEEGQAAVWYGGGQINVYDAARKWEPSGSFTSMALQQAGRDEVAEAAAVRCMRGRGYEVV